MLDTACPSQRFGKCTPPVSSQRQSRWAHPKNAKMTLLVAPLRLAFFRERRHSFFLIVLRQRTRRSKAIAHGEGESTSCTITTHIAQTNRRNQSPALVYSHRQARPYNEKSRRDKYIYWENTTIPASCFYLRVSQRKFIHPLVVPCVPSTGHAVKTLIHSGGEYKLYVSLKTVNPVKQYSQVNLQFLFYQT